MRILRWHLRDMEERERSPKSVGTQCLTAVKPMYEQFAEPFRKCADSVVLNGLVALDMIMRRVQPHSRISANKGDGPGADSLLFFIRRQSRRQRPPRRKGQ